MHRRQFVQHIGGALGAGVLMEAATLTGVLPSGAQARGTSRSANGEPPTNAARWHAERRFIDTTFGRIAYVERGQGDAALFLHGFPLNGFQWRGAFDRLSVHRRCIAADFLGLGYTEVADGQSVAPDAQLAMIVALLDALGVGAVDLVASDSGGAIAQLFVVRHAERVRSVLLTNCDAEPDSPPAALLPVIAMAHEGTYADRGLAPWLADKALARSAQGLGGLTYTYPAQLADETIDCYLAPLVRSQRGKEMVNAYAIGLEQNALAGTARALGRCKAPVRIVWGMGDNIFSADSPVYLSRTFGYSTGVRRVKGAKLFFPEEFPDLIAEEARRLWRVI